MINNFLSQRMVPLQSSIDKYIFTRPIMRYWQSFSECFYKIFKKTNCFTLILFYKCLVQKLVQTCRRQLLRVIFVFSLTSSRSFLNRPVSFLPKSSRTTSLSNWQYLSKCKDKINEVILTCKNQVKLDFHVLIQE